MLPVIAVALCIYASHAYAKHQAYKTGIYMGKAFFTTADYQNQQCLSLRAASFQHRCELTDLNGESAMANAMASATIIPSFSESEIQAMHTGFRDGWRAAGTAAFGGR